MFSSIDREEQLEERRVNVGHNVFLDSQQVAAGRWRSLCEMVSWWWDACPTHWAEVLVLTPWNSSLAHWCCCGDGWSQSASYLDPLTAAEEEESALGASTQGIMTSLHFFSYFHLCSEILFLFSLDFEFHADKKIADSNWNTNLQHQIAVFDVNCFTLRFLDFFLWRIKSCWERIFHFHEWHKCHKADHTWTCYTCKCPCSSGGEQERQHDSKLR